MDRRRCRAEPWDFSRLLDACAGMGGVPSRAIILIGEADVIVTPPSVYDTGITTMPGCGHILVEGGL